MDLKLLKMRRKESKQHHVMFHELKYVVMYVRCYVLLKHVLFEIPAKVLYFEKPFLMIFKYYAWASSDVTSIIHKKSIFRPVETLTSNFHEINSRCLNF